MWLCKICSAVLLVFLFPNPSPQKFSFMGPSFLTLYVQLAWVSREVPFEGETGPSIITRKRHRGSLGCVAGSLWAVELPLGSVFSGPKWPCPEEKHGILRRVLFAHRENIWKNRGYLILWWASGHRVAPWKNFLFWVGWIKKWKLFFFFFFDSPWRNQSKFMGFYLLSF